MYAELSLDHKVLRDIVEKKVIEPGQRRALAEQAIAQQGVSERRACRVLALSRSVYRYQAKKTDEPQIEQALRLLAEQHRRWGYGKMIHYLKHQGYGAERQTHPSHLL